MAIDEARVKAGGEHEDVVVALESRLHGIRKLRTVAARLVDTHADGA